MWLFNLAKELIYTEWLFLETVLAVIGSRLRSEGFFPGFVIYSLDINLLLKKFQLTADSASDLHMFYVLTWFVKPLSRCQLNYDNTVEIKVISQRVGKNSLKRNFVLLVTVLASVLDNQWKVPAILLFYKKINSATWKISERFRQFYFFTKTSTLLLKKSRKMNFLHSFFIEQNAKLLPFLLMLVD